MSRVTENPVARIQDPGGSNGMTAGAGDSEKIALAKTADGTIANASTLLDTYVKPDGIIYVGNCNIICFDVAIVIGSLTSASISPRFSDTRGGVFVIPIVFDITAGSGALNINNNLSFIATTTVAGFFTFPNPGVSWMKVHSSSAGTVTSSSLRLSLIRGWGNTALPTI